MRLVDVVSAPWAITPDMFSEIQGAYARHMRGDKIDVQAIEARVGTPLNNTRTELEIDQGVAIVTLDGVLAKRMNLFMRISGGTSTQIAAKEIRAALADPAVKAIVLNIDSPGGTVDGTQELADLVYSARGVKPIVAVADGTMCSAAYWIGCAADKVFITSDTTVVGSIGVVATHMDYSRQDKNAGIDTTEITAGRFKRLDTESGSLTREGRAEFQAQVDQLYQVFIAAVARNRDTTEDDVHERMADGRTFLGQKAIATGLVDGVATLSQAIDKAAAMAANPTASALDGVSKPAAITEDVPTMDPTVESLKKEHPDVANALVAEGRKAGEDALTATKAEGRLEGAKAERERIQGVFAQSTPGHEALIRELAFDGKTTGPEAAVQVLAAERAKTAQRSKDLRADAGAAGNVASAAAPDAAADAAANPKPKATAAEIAQRAREYQDAEAAKGRKVSDAQAVDHVMKEMGNG